MRELIITGEHPLQGEVTVQGAKNSVLPILAATLLTSSQVELRGCPHLRDVEASVRILEALGCTAPLGRRESGGGYRRVERLDDL